jgi:hypothetical protein
VTDTDEKIRNKRFVKIKPQPTLKTISESPHYTQLKTSDYSLIIKK